MHARDAEEQAANGVDEQTTSNLANTKDGEGLAAAERQQTHSSMSEVTVALAEREAQLLALNEELDRRKAGVKAEETILEQQQRLRELDAGDERSAGELESPARPSDGSSGGRVASSRPSGVGKENEAALDVASVVSDGLSRRAGGTDMSASSPSAAPVRRAHRAPMLPPATHAALESAARAVANDGSAAAELPEATGMGPEAASRYYRARAHVLSEELERLRAMLQRTVRAIRAPRPVAPHAPSPGLGAAHFLRVRASRAHPTRLRRLPPATCRALPAPGAHRRPRAKSGSSERPRPLVRAPSSSARPRRRLRGWSASARRTPS